MTTSKNTPTESTADREINITRVFDAPRELVWEAMTNPKHVVNWWGPRGFSTTIETMDVRPGGVWKHVMRGPDGKNYPNQSVFQEVVKPERIVYAHGGRRENGPGANFLATWSFDIVEGGKTKVTINMVFRSKAERDFVVKEFGAVEGGKQTLERLSEQLATMTSEKGPFILTRTFDAPRELVWKAWTDPEHLKRWFGPKGFSLPVCNMDFRPGGVLHYCLRSPEGHEMWGKWTIREIREPEKLVVIVSFSDAQGGVTRHPMSATWPLETLSTTTFTERDGKTTLTIAWSAYNATEIERSTFDNSHEGMTKGWGGTMEQLTAYLAAIQHS